MPVFMNPKESQVRTSFSTVTTGSWSWKPLMAATTRSAKATDTAYIGTRRRMRET